MVGTRIAEPFRQHHVRVHFAENLVQGRVTTFCRQHQSVPVFAKGVEQPAQVDSRSLTDLDALGLHG